MMDLEKNKSKKSSIIKRLVHSLTFPKGKSKSSITTVLSKSRSYNCPESERPSESKKTPNGCFSVYVGPEKKRFVIKAKYANHPLFKMLLEDVELEYGFNSQGPLLIPCDVDLFYKVLAEMDDSGKDDIYQVGCGSCSPFSPSRLLGNSPMSKGYTPYALLTPPRLLKINHRQH